MENIVVQSTPRPDLLPYAGIEHSPFVLGHGQRGALLLHGFMGTPAEVRPLGEKLAAQGWYAVAPLLPGFGRDIVNLHHRRRTDWIVAAREAWHRLREKYPYRVLVGYSMGATLALHLAVESPPERLVLIAPFWGAPWWAAVLAPLLQLFVPELRPFARADFSDPTLRQRFAHIIPAADLDDPEVQAIIRSRFYLPTQVAHEALKLGAEAVRLVRRYSGPVLVVQGLHDPIIRRRYTQQLVRRLERAVVTYLEIEAGHDLIQGDSLHTQRLLTFITNYLEADR